MRNSFMKIVSTTLVSMFCLSNVTFSSDLIEEGWAPSKPKIELTFNQNYLSDNKEPKKKTYQIHEELGLISYEKELDSSYPLSVSSTNQEEIDEFSKNKEQEAVKTQLFHISTKEKRNLEDIHEDEEQVQTEEPSKKKLKIDYIQQQKQPLRAEVNLSVPKALTPSSPISEMVVQNKDNRKEVPFPECWSHLNRVHGHLKMKFSHLTRPSRIRTYCGSGTMINDKFVLTAGHNLFFRNEKEDEIKHRKYYFPEPCEVNFYPGMDKRTKFKPIKAEVKKRYITSQWQDLNLDRSEADKYDFGLLVLKKNKEKNIGDYTGWYGGHLIEDDELENTELNVTGYPGDLPQMLNVNKLEPHPQHAGRVMYTARGDIENKYIEDVNPNYLYYTLATAHGQSGSAVWIEKKVNEDIFGYYIGIHTVGSHAWNRAVRLTIENNTTIQNWMKQAAKNKKESSVGVFNSREEEMTLSGRIVSKENIVWNTSTKMSGCTNIATGENAKIATKKEHDMLIKNLNERIKNLNESIKNLSSEPATEKSEKQDQGDSSNESSNLSPDVARFWVDKEGTAMILEALDMGSI